MIAFFELLDASFDVAVRLQLFWLARCNFVQIIWHNNSRDREVAGLASPQKQEEVRTFTIAFIFWREVLKLFDIKYVTARNGWMVIAQSSQYSSNQLR